MTYTISLMVNFEWLRSDRIQDVLSKADIYEVFRNMRGSRKGNESDP